MELYNNRLCITHAELTAGIVSSYALPKMVQRGTAVQLRRACAGTCALYEVESLPACYKAEVYRRYPDLKERAESKPFVDSIEIDGKALQYFGDYILSDGRHLSIEKQTEYANNCSILASMGELLRLSDSQRTRQSKPKVKRGDYWKKAAAALPRIGDTLPNSLPTSGRRLEDKYKEYQKEGYQCMISKKYQNKNAAKVDDDSKEAVLTQLMSHHNNLDNVTIALYYNAVAKAQGWEEITASAVGVWKEKFDLRTAAGRRGETNFRNERTMQVKRKRPDAAFLMWSLDGWDVELLYQQVEDRGGHAVTTYCNRMCLEVVLDPCCDYPIGYAIGTHETPALITEALRDAARHSMELAGEMLRSNQIQCDHYGIKTMTELYQVMGDKLTPARVKNAKAKPVEPYFGYLNKTYCKKFNNWSGYGVTTDPKKQPNSEALNLMRHSFPDQQGVIAQIHEMMRWERGLKRQKMLYALSRLPQERRLPLSKENYLMYFGATTGLTNAIEGSGLRPTLLGIKRDYDCFDVSFREHAGEKWAVRFDPDDLSKVLAVNEDGSRRYMLEAKHIQPMALAERTEGDAAALKRVNDFNKELEAKVTEELALSYKKTEALIKDNPRLDNILGRLLICDSEGQHKLPKAKKRMANAKEVDEPMTAQSEAAVPPQTEQVEDYSIF